MPTYGLVTDPNIISQLNAQSAQQYGGMDQTQGALGGIPGADESLHGDAYLKQFPSEVQTGVRDYLAGNSIPTGNPRKTNIIRMVASRYGADIGMPADETAYNERKLMRADLARGSPQSLGGQLRNGTTALDHLSKVARAAHDLGNWSGGGFAPLAHAINQIRGLGTEQASKIGALEDAVDHYGQEIIKFYAGSGGGERERERFQEKMNAAKSPAELAAVIAEERELIPAKMDQIREEIGTKLGPFVGQEYAQKFAEQQQHADKIGAYIAAMRSGRPVQLPPGAGAPSGTAPAPVPGGPVPSPAGAPGGIPPAAGGSGVLAPPGPAPVRPAGPAPMGPPPAGPAGQTFGPTPGPGGPAPGTPPPLVPLQPVPAPGQMRPPAPAALPAPAAAAPAAIPDGAVAINRQTGQRIIRRGGQWVPL